MRPLERACQPLLAELLQLKFQSHADRIADVEQLIETIDHMCATASSSGCPTFDIHAAHYALVAFADEMLASHAPQERGRSPHCLQQHYFGENSAGEGFFLRLEDLLQEEGRHDALEIFALCLALGFQGCYLEASRHKLRTIRRRIREYLAKEPRPESPCFSTNPATQNKELMQGAHFARYFASLAVALSLGVLNGWMMQRELQKQSRALADLSRSLPTLSGHRKAQP